MLIRPFSYDDMEKMPALLVNRDGMDDDALEKRIKAFEWIGCRNPFAGDKPTYFVAEENGDIVAHLGRMPIKLLIGGNPCDAFFFHDLFVHPSLRKAGKGFFVAMSLYKAAESNSDNFCGCIWTTPLNLQMQKRRGYQDFWADRYIKVLNPKSDLKKVLRKRAFVNLAAAFLNPILKILDSCLIHFYQSKIVIKSIQRFDARFDDLSERIAPHVSVSTMKTADYLNWKYIDHPLARFEVLAAEIDGVLTGFIVLSKKHALGNNRMAIVDVSASPNDTRTLSALFAAALKYYRRFDADSIECCITDERIVKIAKRFLFVKADTREPFMLANTKRAKEGAALTPINRWHLCYGDSDGFMWS